jgi:lipopolysaccharide/colanic/teichoic acid biosynthesis glycosyltransferase
MQAFQYKNIKRAFDFSVALFGITVTAPIMLLAAVAIRLESKGKVIYLSKRVGQSYKLFSIYKFRTMYVDADQQTDLMKQLNQYQSGSGQELTECPFCKMLGRNCSPLLYNDNETHCENFYFMKKDENRESSFFKISNDPRVTKVGKFLRKTSIDELPQLFNILKGDMSLVGNRPLPMYEAEKLTTDFAIERFNAPSGLTGLWQVSKRGKGDMSETERIELDKTYAREWSLKSDFKIILKTFPALLQEENV